MQLRLLKLEYVPLLVLVLAAAQMASMADRGTFQLSYAVAGLFSFVCLVSGAGLYLYLKNRDLTAARIAFTTGVLFFVLLFGVGEYIFATYFPG